MIEWGNKEQMLVAEGIVIKQLLSCDIISSQRSSVFVPLFPAKWSLDFLFFCNSWQIWFSCHSDWEWNYTFGLGLFVNKKSCWLIFAILSSMYYRLYTYCFISDRGCVFWTAPKVLQPGGWRVPAALLTPHVGGLTPGLGLKKSHSSISLKAHGKARP
jgi:hypothetical protein